MHKSKRIITSVAAAATIVLMAAACGDSTATTVGAAPSTSGPTTTAALGLPLGAGPYPIADISVSVHPDGVESPPTSTYRISCLGDTASATGDAPATAADMCLALTGSDVHDLLVNGAPAGRICTEIYGGPDVARFTGTLDDSKVDFTADRVNGCAINDWDSVLVQLLP